MSEQSSAAPLVESTTQLAVEQKAKLVSRATFEALTATIPLEEATATAT